MWQSWRGSTPWKPEEAVGVADVCPCAHPSTDFHTADIYCTCLPPGKAAVYHSALLLEEQQRHLCCSQYCISRTCSVAFEILLPAPHIPPGQLGRMPGGGDGPLPRVAVPRRGTGAERQEPSLLGLGKRGSQANDRGMKCKYSISCKVN